MKYKMGFCAIFVAATILSLGLCAAAEARVLIKPDVYVIQMSNSDMTVACTSDAEHSPLILWPTRPTASWSFDTTGNGYYAISSSLQHVLDGGTGKTGAAITKIQMNTDWANQMWRVVKVGKYYKFINFKSGQAMTLRSGKRTPGSRIEMAPVANTPDQLFCIQRVEHVGYCGEGGSYVDYSGGSFPEKKGNAEYLRLLQEGKVQQGQPKTKMKKVPQSPSKDTIPTDDNSITNAK